MLLVRKSLLESERDALTTIINYNTTQNPDAQEAAVEMERDLQLNTTMRTGPMLHSISWWSVCVRTVRPLRQQPIASVRNWREEWGSPVCHLWTGSQYESAALFLRSKEQFNEYLQARMGSLMNEISNIDSKLPGTRPYLGEIVDLDSLNRTDDDQWTQFEYDSKS